LNAAYAGGLLSDETFERRVDHVLKARVIDPFQIVGDLNLRGSVRGPVLSGLRAAASRIGAGKGAEAPLLALDWSGAHQELLLGRHQRCDLVFSNLNVSRRHARLVFRDGTWILQDLGSKNGTFVNGVRVQRCELRPGDRLALGDEALWVD
jgi:hypothetical protein